MRPDPSKRRAILITGASRGLGRELALCFGRAGDRVAVNYRDNAEAAGQTSVQVIANGGEAMICCGDVKNTASVDSMVDDIVNKWGTIDVLINNAGIVRDALAIRMSDNEWDEVIDTNLSGVFRVTRSVARIMKESGKGHIIGISSLSGIQGRAGQANYAASKSGLIGLTKALAREFGGHDIQVNAVLPGYLPTDMGSAVSNGQQSRMSRDCVLGRHSQAREVAEFILHLSRMRNVSGQIFNLDSRIL